MEACKQKTYINLKNTHINKHVLFLYISWKGGPKRHYYKSVDSGCLIELHEITVRGWTQRINSKQWRYFPNATAQAATGAQTVSCSV